MTAVGSQVAVIGAGSWGSTVAHLCAHNTSTVLVSRERSLATTIDRTAENPRYLPGFKLHPGLRATSDLGEAVTNAHAVVMGVPSHGFRAMLKLLAPFVGQDTPVVSLTKGLEIATGWRMTEIVAEELPGRPVGVLTGPNLAKEILAGQPAAAVLAMTAEDVTTVTQLRDLVTTGSFRVYTSTDLVGAEIAGATKNVIALACGIADGLGAGDNARAALITRGLAEVTRLGVAFGGQAVTFAGLAGIGDIVATCVSAQSRNRQVGERLGRGESIAQILASMDQVAEGVRTVPVVVSLAQSQGVSLPIAEAVRAVIEDGCSAAGAYRRLLDRPPTCEHCGHET